MKKGVLLFVGLVLILICTTLVMSVHTIYYDNFGGVGNLNSSWSYDLADQIITQVDGVLRVNRSSGTQFFHHTPGNNFTFLSNYSEMSFSFSLNFSLNTTAGIAGNFMRFGLLYSNTTNTSSEVGNDANYLFQIYGFYSGALRFLMNGTETQVSIYNTTYDANIIENQTYLFLLNISRKNGKSEVLFRPLTQTDNWTRVMNSTTTISELRAFNVGAIFTGGDGRAHEIVDFDNFNISINQVNPTTTQPSLNQSEFFKTTSQITCVNGSFVDADGDSPYFFYKWFNGSNVIPNNVTQNLTNQSYNKFDLVKCEVTPWDGFVNGTGINSSVVNVSNFVPTTSTPSINLTVAYKNSSNIYCNNVSVYDADGDSISWNYSWFKNGTSAGITTQFIGNASYNHFNNLSCEIRAFDSFNYSIAYNSTVLMVNNSVPLIKELVWLRNNTLTSNQSINMSWNASTDDDGDVQTYYFFIDGILNYTTANTSFLANITNGGHNWSVKSNDGYDNSSMSAVFNFTVDYELPFVFNDSVSSSSVVSGGTTTFFVYANDSLSGVSSVSVSLVDSNNASVAGSPFSMSLNESNRWTYSYVVTASVNVKNFTVTDSAGNFNYSTSSLSVSLSSGSTGGGGGGGGTISECSANLTCVIKYGDKYYCKADKCILLEAIAQSAVSACNYNGVCEAGLGEDWWSCGDRQVEMGGVLTTQVGDCHFSIDQFSFDCFKDKSKQCVWKTSFFAGFAALLVLAGFGLLLLTAKKKKRRE